MNEEVNHFIVKAAGLLAGARRIAILTGAGVSAESGVATFRDAQTGLWTHFDVQQLASQEGFAADPGVVWRWYMHRLNMVEEAQPNPGHRALADLETLIPGFTLVTQNIDDLHERAGSQRVLHLHGHIGRFHCNQCGAIYTLQAQDRQSALPPSCRSCNGYVRPSIVWFGEMLPEPVLDEAWRAAEQCDVFLVVGTSGVVYPAAQLPRIAQRHGAHIIDVNTESSGIAENIGVMLLGPSGKVLPALAAALQNCRHRSANRDDSAA